MVASLGLCQGMSIGEKAALDFKASVGPGFGGDSSLAKIIEEQRFVVDNGNKFGHAAHQEDGSIFMEQATGQNNRIGAYSYIGDDGKVYTVKYEAGVNGFRILSGDHIPSGGQTAANAALDENNEPEEYDYEYYEDTPAQQSPFVNPHDPSHQTKQLLAGNLAGHLAGVLEQRKQFDPITKKPPTAALGLNPLDPTATPSPLRRFFPDGTVQLDRFNDGFNFKFRSDKK